jgi:hypothetical protein
MGKFGIGNGVISAYGFGFGWSVLAVAFLPIGE